MRTFASKFFFNVLLMLAGVWTTFAFPLLHGLDTAWTARMISSRTQLFPRGHVPTSAMRSRNGVLQRLRTRPQKLPGRGTERAALRMEEHSDRQDKSSAATSLTPVSKVEIARQWWPLAATTSLHKDIPNSITILNRRLVVWNKNGSWQVQDDVCPHKLAPLSSGFITEEGNLMCSYHGWEFNGFGKCVRIPQISKDVPIRSACSVRTYQVSRLGDVLWVWMDPDTAPDGGPNIAPEEQNLYVGNMVYQRELEYSYDFLIENLLDPAHASHAHHMVSPVFNRREVDTEQLQYMSSGVSDYNVSVTVNRTLAGRAAPEVFRFDWPCTWVNFRGVMVGGFRILITPIDRMRTRVLVFASTPHEPEPVSWIEKLKQFQAHLFWNDFFDSDAHLVHAQMHNSRQQNRDPLKTYTLAIPQEKATSLFRRWFNAKFDGEVPLLEPDSRESQLLPPEKTTNAWEQHSKHCEICTFVEKVARRVRLAALVTAALSTLGLAWAALAAASVFAAAASVVSVAVCCVVAQTAHRLVKRFHRGVWVHGIIFQR